jgi:hypothetical protein
VQPNPPSSRLIPHGKVLFVDGLHSEYLNDAETLSLLSVNNLESEICIPGRDPVGTAQAFFREAIHHPKIINLYAAAKTIADRDDLNIKIVTGFMSKKLTFVKQMAPPLQPRWKNFFYNLNIPCQVVTDIYCANVCEAALDAAGIKNSLLVMPDNLREIQKLKRSWEDDFVSHAIAIERAAPTFWDNNFKNLQEETIQHCAPLHILFQSRYYTTIACVDRGNEIGCGSINPSAML